MFGLGRLVDCHPNRDSALPCRAFGWTEPWEHKFSCTLMCLFAGVAIGCSIAWYWVKRESLAAEESDNDLQREEDTQKRGTTE